MRLQIRIEQAAQIAHEALYYHAILVEHHPVISQHHYESLTLLKKTIVRTHVRRVLLGASPEELHHAWMEDKIQQGWSHSDAYQPHHLTHPSLVAWKSLTREKQQRNILFHAVVKAFREISTTP